MHNSRAGGCINIPLFWISLRGCCCVRSAGSQLDPPIYSYITCVVIEYNLGHRSYFHIETDSKRQFNNHDVLFLLLCNCYI